MSETDRLRTLTHEVQATLEERISDLLGQMKAIREVTTQIATIDGEINGEAAAADELEASLASVSKSSQKLEIMQKIEGMRQTVEQGQAYREQLLDQLDQLAADLRGGQR